MKTTIPSEAPTKARTAASYSERLKHHLAIYKNEVLGVEENGNMEKERPRVSAHPSRA